jgi:diacylglycerol kinase family enzyme
MRVFVLLNPHCGSIRRNGGIRRIMALVESSFSSYRITASIDVVRGGVIADRIRRAIAAGDGASCGFDAVVVGGGDGSVSAAASVLAGGDLPMGVLPLGTFNHFARDLRMPLDLEAAVAVIARRRVARIDVGEVNGVAFVNNSSLGIYPHLVTERKRARRRGVSKWAALLLALIRVIWRMPSPRLRIAAAEHAAQRRTPCVFVGNNLYDLDPFATAKRSRLDRGELCVYIVNREGRLALLRLACRAVAGKLEPARDLILIRTGQMMIAARRSRLRVALDGEARTMSTPLSYRIRPRALPVFVPDIQ